MSAVEDLEAVGAQRPTLRVIETARREQRLPPPVLAAAAEAAGVYEGVLDEAITMALAGGPDSLRTRWYERAACLGDDPVVLYPGRGATGMGQTLDRCRCECPVQASCLAAALAGEREGVWGGTSASARQRLRVVLREAGILGVVGEDAYLAWMESGADREPPADTGGRYASLAPWPHQLDAVDKVCTALALGGKCQVAMATASGKTHVGLWAAERLAVARVLVLVPSLSLIAQTAEVWRAAGDDRAMLAVCSDTGELPLESTTDPARVSEFLGEHRSVLILGTYQSSAVLAEAGAHFDLTIADEAHHLAGEADKTYAAIVRGEILTDRTLYMTATPRTYRRTRKDVELVGMDDEAAFGPRVFELSLSDAVAAGVVADYRVIVAAVERDAFDRAAAHPDLADVDPHLLAGAIAVNRAMGDLRLSSCVSFHTRVDRARTFAQLVGLVAEALPDLRPPGPGWAGYVHGGTSVRIRRRLLARLGDGATWGVVANAKALGEGVDLPTLDAVAIVDPKNAEADVMQATGRALRRPSHGDKTVGTILLPVLLTEHPDPADPLGGIDQRSLDVVSGVLRALRAHDTELGARLDITRRHLAHSLPGRPDVAAAMRRKAARGLLRSRVELWVPGGATGDIAGALSLHIVRETTADWHDSFGRLLAYVEEHGTSRIPQTYTVPDETGTFGLGAWVSGQRTRFNRGILPPERAAALEALPAWTWDPREDGWWEKFEALKDYVEVHRRLPGFHNGAWRQEWKGVRVGSFAAVCRSAVTDHENGWIWKFPDRMAALEAIPGWVWNTKDASWEANFALLERYVAAFGHADPRIGETVDGVNIARWVSKQRSRINGTSGSADRRGGRTGANVDLSPQRIARLRALPGWVDHTREAAWENGYARLMAYATANDGDIPRQQHEEPDGYKLGVWVFKQRQDWQWGRDRLTAERIRRLEEIPGWFWRADPNESRWRPGNDLAAQWNRQWEDSYDRLVAWAAENGHASPPQKTVLDGAHRLGHWVHKQRLAYRAGRLVAYRVERLEALPAWTWASPRTEERAARAAERGAPHG